MVLLCTACGVQQLADTVKFCCDCGAKLGEGQKVSSPKRQQGQKGPLIRPVEGEGARASPLVYCTAHPDKKVVGFCRPCQDLVCFACMAGIPRQHDSCGELQPLDDFLTSADPFKDQRSLLCDTLQSQTTFLQKLQTSQGQVEAQGQAEISKLRQMEQDALTVLDGKFKAEVSKLETDRDRQKEQIEDVTQRKVKDLERSLQKMIDEFQDRIDDVSANVKNLQDTEQKLSSSVGVENVTEQVGASKEAGTLVSQTPDPRLPHTTPPGVTPHDKTALHALAELTVRVTELQLKGEIKSEAKVEAKKGPAVPLSGPGSEAHFQPGVRVARGPDWNPVFKFDGNGPGRVVGVSHGGPGVVRVKWEKTGYTVEHDVGKHGKYELRLLDPPSPQ